MHCFSFELLFFRQLRLLLVDIMSYFPGKHLPSDILVRTTTNMISTAGELTVFIALCWNSNSGKETTKKNHPGKYKIRIFHEQTLHSKH